MEGHKTQNSSHDTEGEEQSQKTDNSRVLIKLQKSIQCSIG